MNSGPGFGVLEYICEIQSIFIKNPTHSNATDWILSLNDRKNPASSHESEGTQEVATAQKEE